MNCDFNRGLCSTTCPKYALCMYNSLQEQISEINNQLNFILTTFTKISCEIGNHKERFNIVESDIKDLVTTILDMTNDSEMKH